MISVIFFVRRNTLVYFRELGSVFLSLLSTIILAGLYVVFLGQQQHDRIAEQLPHASGNEIQVFLSSWVVAGMVMIATFTTGIGALGCLVDDRATGRFNDFLVSPLRRWQLILGYQLTAFIVAVLMGTIILTGGTAVVWALWRYLPSATDLLIAEALVGLLSFAFSALASFLLTFIRSRGGFTGVSVIVGTVLGFIAGAYLPIGTLSSGVGNVINVLPFSQGAMLLRTPLAGDALGDLSLGQNIVREQLGQFYGFHLFVGDLEITTLFTVLALFGIGIFFTFLGSIRIGRLIR